MDLFELASDLEAAGRLHRNPDHSTSIEAAKSVLPCRTALQDEIYEVLKRQGPMTDGELENLPRFCLYGPSTVRKRRSELYQQGRVVDTGAKRSKMKVWRIA